MFMLRPQLEIQAAHNDGPRTLAYAKLLARGRLVPITVRHHSAVRKTIGEWKLHRADDETMLHPEQTSSISKYFPTLMFNSRFKKFGQFNSTAISHQSQLLSYTVFTICQYFKIYLLFCKFPKSISVCHDTGLEVEVANLGNRSELSLLWPHNCRWALLRLYFIINHLKESSINAESWNICIPS